MGLREGSAVGKVGLRVLKTGRMGLTDGSIVGKVGLIEGVTVGEVGLKEGVTEGVPIVGSMVG